MNMTKESTDDHKRKQRIEEAGKRARAEAEARRATYDEAARKAVEQEEFNGQKGPEPTRFGDWESKGITSDF